MKTETEIRRRLEYLQDEYDSKNTYKMKLELHNKITELMFVLGE